jgi:hypothetical protein
MDKNEQELFEQIKSGNLDLDALQNMSSESLTSPVTITDWGTCYSSATGQLSAFCTVTCNNSGDNITGVGLTVYKANSSTMFCLQYTNDFASPSVMTSVGTNLYTTSMGNQVLCVVYGFTQNSGYYFVSNTLTVGSC